MNTIHTSSLTHEIESYSGRAALLDFIKNRFQELIIGGVWINRDVVAPHNKDKTVYMKLNKDDGRNEDYEKAVEGRDELRQYLEGLSTFTRFKRFAADFRKKEGNQLQYEIIKIGFVDYIIIKLKDACEYISRKDYIDNWMSEMHETFCYWSFEDWKENLEKAGFKIKPESSSFSNLWIIENRFIGKVELFNMIDSKLFKMDYPVTNMVLIAEK
jgi:hypothetical protein